MYTSKNYDGFNFAYNKNFAKNNLQIFSPAKSLYYTPWKITELLGVKKSKYNLNILVNLINISTL